MGDTTNLLGGSNICMIHSGLAAGTTTTITTVATNVAIKGRTYAVGAGSNGAAPTLDGNTGVAFLPLNIDDACVFVVGYDAGGTRKAYQGPIVSNSAYLGKAAALDFPDIPDDVCPVGYIVIQCGPTKSGDWVFGANNMSSVTGVTYTFQSCAYLPSKPISA